jgi:hypothetical protein
MGPNRVKNPKSINELIRNSGRRVSDLRSRVQARSRALEHVRAALPSPLAQNVVSAGLEQGRLTIGVGGAAWAARLRYVTGPLRLAVGSLLGVDIREIRIKVVPPRRKPPSV